MVISDGFIKDGGSSDFPGFEQYAKRPDMIARLVACGDNLVGEYSDLTVQQSHVDVLALAAALARGQRRQHQKRGQIEADAFRDKENDRPQKDEQC